MQNPEVSIGLPVYNGGLFLRQAIDSLLNQTYSDFEIIISDNASSDDTQSICMEYMEKDFRITYYRQEANIGASNNFEFVLSKASGAFFMWAAHDDLWSEEWVERLVKCHDSSSILVFGRAVNINNSNIIINEYPCLYFTGRRFFRSLKYYFSEDRLGKPNLICGLFKTSSIKQLSFKKYEKFDYGQDMLFVFDVLQKGSIKCDDTVLLYKRLSQPFKKSFSIKNIINSMFLVKRINSYLYVPEFVENEYEKLSYKLFFFIKFSKSLIYNYYYYFKNFLVQLVNRWS
jgi:glycosyltransferase involved in cell wall biosynthesis